MKRASALRLRLARVVAGAAALAASATIAPSARADDPPDDTGPPPDAYATFLYRRPAERYHFRAALEEVALFGAGLVQYFSNQSGNARDWALDFTGDSLKKKVEAKAIDFDTNKFDTNWVTHPAAGWLYYVAARGNRLSLLESSLFTVAGSTLWEFIGEYREEASINDMIVTPMTGIVVGEALTQLGASFERDCGGAPSQIVAAFFGTSKWAHDLVDGAEPWCPPPEQRGWREVRVGAAVGATWASGDRDTAWVDERVDLRSRVVHAPRHRVPGDTELWLHDANVSQIDLTLVASEGIFVDGHLVAMISPLGYYVNHTRANAGGSWSGSGFYLGPSLAFDYQVHVEDRRHAERAGDKIAQVSPAGLTWEDWVYFGPVRVRGSMDVAAQFASVTAVALDDWRQRHPDPKSLPAVTRSERYYYALGATLAPGLEVAVGAARLSGDARLDAWRDVTPSNEKGTPVMWDRRLDAGLRASVRLPLEILEMGAQARYRLRTGHVGESVASYHEASLLGDVTLVF